MNFDVTKEFVTSMWTGDSEITTLQIIEMLSSKEETKDAAMAAARASPTSTHYDMMDERISSLMKENDDWCYKCCKGGGEHYS